MNYPALIALAALLIGASIYLSRQKIKIRLSRVETSCPRSEGQDLSRTPQPATLVPARQNELLIVSGGKGYIFPLGEKNLPPVLHLVPADRRRMELAIDSPWNKDGTRKVVVH